jgi:hypothetical protein
MDRFIFMKRFFCIGKIREANAEFSCDIDEEICDIRV